MTENEIQELINERDLLRKKLDEVTHERDELIKKLEIFEETYGVTGAIEEWFERGFY